MAVSPAPVLRPMKAVPAAQGVEKALVCCFAAVTVAT
jgi:hypothetical protein